MKVQGVTKVGCGVCCKGGHAAKVFVYEASCKVGCKGPTENQATIFLR